MGTGDDGGKSEEKSSDNKEKKDFSGIWNRTKQDGMENVLAASGAGYMQKKLGASMALTHTITMNTPALTAFRLHEKGGPLNLDSGDCKSNYIFMYMYIIS